MKHHQKQKIKDKIFCAIGYVATFSGLFILAYFLIDIFIDGFNRIDYDFLTGFTSRKAENAGILPAWVGSVWILGLTIIFAIPIGIGAGIYFEEYARKNKLTYILEVNIANLAGVPSIIYGLLGLEVFGRLMGFGGSLLTGSLTLSLLILPIIIVSTRESLKAVPQSLRDASHALGATQWQTIWYQVLPSSMGGILTGTILALSRAVGETAPLIVIGALAYVDFVPTSPMDDFSVLPMQIFNWTSRPQHSFIINAAAAIIILLAITFIMNSIAIYLRNRWQKKIQW